MTTTVTYTEAQQLANWLALDADTRAYFYRLSLGDSSRNGQEFFQDTVPPELQDDPSHVDTYLNGGTVEVPVEVHDRGRAGSTYETVEYEVSDKDWSHDVSDKNGGSGSADNGRFEDASTNRARGGANSTTTEQATADAASDADVEALTGGVTVEQAADLTLTAEAAELAGTVLDVAVDFVAPLVGGAAVAKLCADKFEKTEHKVAAGAGGGVATALLLTTPLGQAGLGCYLGYKLCRTGYRFFNKRATA